MNRSTPGLPVHHQLLEFTQTHVHQVSDAIQPSHPLSSPSPPAYLVLKKKMWTQCKIWIPGLNNSKKKKRHPDIFTGARGLGCSMWDQVPWPEIEPGPPALEAQNLSYWTTREVPQLFLLGKGQGFSYTRSVSRDFHKHPGQLKPHWAQALSSAWPVNSQAQPKVHGFHCPRWAALCIHTTGLSIPRPAPPRDKMALLAPSLLHMISCWGREKELLRRPLDLLWSGPSWLWDLTFPSLPFHHAPFHCLWPDPS